MHDVPGWVEDVRTVILAFVLAVLLVRAPACLNARQRPVWLVLCTQLVGAAAIQPWLARWVDHVTHVAKASELVVALVALTDFAMVWWLAVTLRAADRPVPAWLRRAPVACAASMAAIAVAVFAVTPAQERYGVQARGPWVWYAVAWTCYGAVTAVGAASIFWRYAARMRATALRVSVLALAVGASAELPYLAGRATLWFDGHAPRTLVVVDFWCSFTRFVLVASGCALAAVEPVRRATVHWCRRQRLYGLWRTLRAATPEIAVAAPPSRAADLMTLNRTSRLLRDHLPGSRAASSTLPALAKRPRMIRYESAPPPWQRGPATRSLIEQRSRNSL